MKESPSLPLNESNRRFVLPYFVFGHARATTHFNIIYQSITKVLIIIIITITALTIFIYGTFNAFRSPLFIHRLKIPFFFVLFPWTKLSIKCLASLAFRLARAFPFLRLFLHAQLHPMHLFQYYIIYRQRETGNALFKSIVFVVKRDKCLPESETLVSTRFDL